MPEKADSRKQGGYSEGGDLALIDRLAAIPYSGALTDVLDEMGFRSQVLPHSVRPLFPGSRLAGRALTIVGEQTSVQDPDVIFPPILNMLGSIVPGDVPIYQAEDCVSAHMGELSAETAKFRGARGAVIDGGARDTEYIGRLGFPVFARYTTPLDVIGRWRLVDWNQPIKVGEVSIRPGDFVLGDRDGVVVIPQAVAEEAVSKAERIVSTENKVRSAILRGVLPIDAYHEFKRF